MGKQIIAVAILLVAASAAPAQLREDIRTIYVPMFKADFKGGKIAFDMTRAVSNEIQLQTPYRVVHSSNEVDSKLAGKISTKANFPGMYFVDLTWQDLRGLQEKTMVRVVFPVQDGAEKTIEKVAKSFVQHMTGEKAAPPICCAPASKVEQTPVVKVYDISGLLDPYNLDRSKAELLEAICLAAPATTCCGGSVVILSHVQRLVVRQTPENQERIERLLKDLKASMKAGPPPAICRPLPMALDF